MITKPTCLHIPHIYEESTARPKWEMVDAAQGYELDLHFDEDFQSALTGKVWDNLDEDELIWQEIDGESLSWGEFEALPAQGVDWKYFEFLDMNWDKIESEDMPWYDFQKLDPKFTVFRGEGEKVPGPDQGLTWDNLDGSADVWNNFEDRQWTWEDFELRTSIGQCWYQIDDKEKSWNEIETAPMTWHDIEHLVPYGLTWGSLEGRWNEWDEIDGFGHTWKGLEELPADVKTHIAHTVEIPTYKKKAQFRVRAFKDKDYSDYLTSALLGTLPRSLAKYKPPCLHIPNLYEDGDAVITWGDLYGAQKFVLERKLGDKEYEVVFHGEGVPVADPFNKAKCPILSKINDVKTHYTFKDHIPLYEKTVTYRVKAYNTTDHSQYLVSETVKTLPRSLVKYKPPCLHIPNLYEDGDAVITWGDLYGAQKFVLERKLGDKQYEVVFHGEGVPVADPLNKAKCAILSKINDVKTHYTFKDHIPLYEKTVTYRVKAYNTTDHSQYLVSETVKTLPRSLAKYKPPCLHVPELHEGKQADISWGDLYGAQKFVLERKLGNKGFAPVFNDVGVPVADQNNKKTCVILSKINNVDTHFHFVDTVPVNEKTAIYRVKAYNTTDHSQYLESVVIPLIPVFYRDAQTQFTVTKDQTYILQLYADNVASFSAGGASGIEMTLEYPADALWMDGDPKRTLSYGLPVVNPAQKISLQVFPSTLGKTRFRCSDSLSGEEAWSGLVATFRFVAINSTTVIVKLY